MAGELGLGDTVDAEGAPLTDIAIPTDQVPAAAGVGRLERLDAALTLPALIVAVGEADTFAAQAAGGHDDQRLGGDVRDLRRAHVNRGRVQGAYALSKGRGHDLFDLGQSRHRGGIDPRDGRGRREPQADGEGHRLVVVEEQRREPPSDAELVPVRGGIHRVAQVPQPGDVPAHCSGRDVQALGELLAAPGRTRLEQRVKAKKSRRRIHVGIMPPYEDRIRPPSGRDHPVADVP